MAAKKELSQNDALATINTSLKSLIESSEASLRIVVETGYDEAGLVATREGFLRLAQALVEFALLTDQNGTEIWDIYGRAMPASSSVGALFTPGDEVKIDSLLMAESEDQVRQIAEDFYVNSPSGLWVQRSDE